MATQGGDVSFRFTGDTSGLEAAVRTVAREQEAAAASAVKAAAAAAAALEAERAATVKVTDAEKELAKQMAATDAAAKAKASVLGVTVSQLKQVEAATARAEAAQAAQSATVGTAATKFDKLGMAMGPIGGVLSKISPEAGAAASSIAGLTSGFQGLTAAGIALETMVPVVTVLAGVVAAATYAWTTYNDQVKEAADRAEGHKAALATEADYVTELERAQYHLKETVGVLTEAEAKQQIRRETSAKLAKDSVGMTDEQASALRGLASNIAYAKEQEIEYAYAQKASEEALAAKAKSAAQAATAQAALAKQEAETLAAAKEVGSAQDAAYAQFVEHEKLMRTQRAETLHDYIDGKQAEIDIAKKAADKEVKAAKDAAKEKIAVNRQMTSAIADLAGSTHDLLIMYAESQAKHNRKAALAAFYAAQAVAAIQAGVNTALAVTNALATVPYPAAPFVAAAAGVAGGIEIATILASKPSFHSGGMLYPDEGNAKLLAGEPVINRQAAARIGLDNPAAVADVNHGGAGGPSLGGVTVLRIGRLEAREIVRSDVVSGGLIVQTAKTAAMSGRNLAGRTGRRPMA